MAHTDYSKMEANHKARRSAERQDMHRERLHTRNSLSNMRKGIADPDNVVFVSHKGMAKCAFCKTPGYWCSC